MNPEHYHLYEEQGSLELGDQAGHSYSNLRRRRHLLYDVYLPRDNLSLCDQVCHIGNTRLGLVPHLTDHHTPRHQTNETEPDRQNVIATGEALPTRRSRV